MTIESDIAMKQITVENTGRLTYRADSSSGTLIAADWLCQDET